MDAALLLSFVLGLIVQAVFTSVIYRVGRRDRGGELMQLQATVRELSVERVDRRSQMLLGKNLVDELAKECGATVLGDKLEKVSTILTERRRLEGMTEKIARLSR